MVIKECHKPPCLQNILNSRGPPNMTVYHIEGFGKLILLKGLYVFEELGLFSLKKKVLLLIK